MIFSIIVANYNNGQYLPELINSVLKQTYKNWELIIVDDCSTEDPGDYIKPFLTDKRIKFIKHSINLGAGGAFKTATDNTSGEIIGMLGADDALVPEAVEKMVSAHIQHPEASLINSDCYWCDEQLTILHQYEHYKALEPGQTLMRHLSVGSFATFKRSAYLKTEGFDPYLKKAVDHDIYLKLDEVGTLEYVHEPLYLYRKNPIGISQNQNGLKAAQFSNKAVINACKRRLGTTKENFTDTEIVTLKKTWYLREIFSARIEKRKDDCNRFLKEAFREVPGIIFSKTFWINTMRNNFFSIL